MFEIQKLIGYKKNGYMKLSTLLLQQQIITLVGIFNGIGMRTLNLLNIKKDSFMIGIWTVGQNLIKVTQEKILKVKLENWFKILKESSDY